MLTIERDRNIGLIASKSKSFSGLFLRKSANNNQNYFDGSRVSKG